MFFFVSSASKYNSLSPIEKTVAELKTKKHSKSEVVSNKNKSLAFKNNKMIINPEEFEAIILDKQNMAIQMRLLKLIRKQLRLCLLSDIKVLN